MGMIKQRCITYAYNHNCVDKVKGDGTSRIRKSEHSLWLVRCLYTFYVEGSIVTLITRDMLGVRDKETLNIVEARKRYRELLNDGAKKSF